jgi:uncharacterized protein YPO0396
MPEFTNLPAQSLALRARLCADTGVDEASLPFAGELILVRPDSAEWEGAAERLLRGFALSLLVPQAHYAAVSDWIERHHLRARLVYFRVPETIMAARPTAPPTAGGRDLLVDLLEVKESPLPRWLERELAHRADY